MYEALDEARNDPTAVLVMEAFYDGQTYLTCPVGRIGCSSSALAQLLDDLNSLAWGDGERLYFTHAPAGSHVPGGMRGGEVENDVWLHRDFEELHLLPAVRQILSGVPPWVEVPSAFDQIRRFGRKVPLVAPEHPDPAARQFALICASAAGNTERVRELSSLADLNSVDDEGWSPLLWAAVSGHSDTVAFLLERGANPNLANQFGETPLMWACWRGHQEIVGALLRAGAEVNTRTEADRHFPETWHIMPVFSGGQSAAHLAVQNGNVDILRQLIDCGALINHADARKVTPLMHARSAEVASLLIEAGADVQARDCDQRSPLVYAITAGRLDVIQTLVAAGARFEFKEFRTKEAVSEAIDGGHLQVLQYVLDQGMDINGPMPFRANLLGVAVRQGQREIAQALMRQGARPLNELDMLGRTPLLDALLEGLGETVVQGLLDAGADPNVAIPQQTPLMAAAWRSEQTDCLRALLKAGARVDQAAIESGQTPLMIAARCHKLATVEFLLSAGANPHAVDKTKRTALDYAKEPAGTYGTGQREQVIARLKAVR